jgi:hypothetical protein
MTILSRTATTLSTLAFVLGGMLAQASWAGEEDPAALLQALPKSKLTLADGLKQSTKGAETPISAKFELDDSKQLSLSVYTAEKGLGVDSEHNVLKELAGSPEKTPWTPEAEVFKDLPHVARASQHLTLTAVAKQSLVEIVTRAQKEHSGMVFSVAPAIHDKKAVFAVHVADKGKVSEYLYDAVTGTKVAGEK